MSNESTEKAASPHRAEYHSALGSGLMIGRYRIVSVLGEGGFGITYSCTDTQLHRNVAIKEYLPSGLAIRQGGTEVLPRSTETSKDFVWGRSRFLDEARTMAKLSRVPAVVRVHDFLETHGTAYVVMELLQGETLQQRLGRQKYLSQAEIDRILPPLLEGLEQIHSVGFLHRDIKPANIILGPEDQPTLIDFGASRAAVAGRSELMTAVFTPGFAAPEQSSAGRQGPWTDIYGLAATRYACVTGAPPPSAMERLLDTDAPLSFEAAVGDYAPNLMAAINAGMLLQPNMRPQSIEAWRDVLATGVMSLPDAAPRAAQQTQFMPRPAVDDPSHSAGPRPSHAAPSAVTPTSEPVATARHPAKPMGLAAAG
ncbi:MAG: protein kinase, partial [Reyranella sp.]|nr:protein kinase [Reyranella sp.]